MSVGKVFLVGAGPGDEGLITIKGKHCLEIADVVVYDQLANAQMTRFSRPNAELIFVGKRSGSFVLSQDEINELF